MISARIPTRAVLDCSTGRLRLYAGKTLTADVDVFEHANPHQTAANLACPVTQANRFIERYGVYVQCWSGMTGIVRCAIANRPILID